MIGPEDTPKARRHPIPSEIVTLEDDTVVTQEEATLALNYLTAIGTELVRGDLIVFEANAGYRNDGVAIYDGVGIINLDDEEDEYGHLPSQFRVIEGGTPIDYWDSIEHNSIVWFDHNLVRDQLAANLAVTPVDGIETAVSHFDFEGEPYIVVFDASYMEEEDEPGQLAATMINSEALFPFNRQSSTYSLTDPNLLYVLL